MKVERTLMLAGGARVVVLVDADGARYVAPLHLRGERYVWRPAECRPVAAGVGGVRGRGKETGRDGGIERSQGISARPVVIELANPPVNLHPNSSAHWRTRAQWARFARNEAMLSAYNVRPPVPFARCRARADFRFRVQRRRDADNLMAWIKHTIDGLTDAAIWVDDAVVTWEPPTITVDHRQKPGLTITVWEVED